MRSTYRVLAYIIAAEVVVQAAMMAFAVAGLFTWIDKDGGSLDKAVLESEPDFTGAVGFLVHGMNGMMLIPLLALIFLIISFFAKIPGGVAWAATVFGLVVLQVALGLFGHENAIFGLLHGINALAVFSVALMAGKRVSSTPAATVGGHATV
jgi:hypothetical protein